MNFLKKSNENDNTIIIEGGKDWFVKCIKKINKFIISLIMIIESQIKFFL